MDSNITLNIDIDGDGTIDTTLTSVFTNLEEENSNSKVNKYSVSQNYPNPFNPTTTISYSVPATSIVKLKIFNLLGQEIVTLVNEEKPLGDYQVEFDASNLSSGVYLYKIQAGDFVQTKKMILMK